MPSRHSDGSRSDDGERLCVARPLHHLPDVLRHQHLEGVLAAVVRYYGGVKLGAGGLVRAYTQALNEALLLSQTVPVVVMTQCRARIAFADEARFRRHCEALQIAVLSADYGEQVELSLSLPQNQCTSLQMRLHTPALSVTFSFFHPQMFSCVEF